MAENQQPTGQKIFAKTTRNGRVIAIWLFLAGLAVIVFLVLAGRGVIDISKYMLPCGMKIKYGLPCPTCGFTTSALAFFSGDVLGAFYIQPAAALLCLALVIMVFLAFITAVFGVYFPFLKDLAGRIKPWQFAVVVIVILLAAWAVTLSRALAQRGM
jgi:hypothetical protein